MSVSYTKIGTRKQNGKHPTAGLAHTRGETGCRAGAGALGLHSADPTPEPPGPGGPCQKRSVAAL